jgi:hypothetical protein
MKNLIISTLILFTLVCSCQSLQVVNISRESSAAILANVSSNSGHQAININRESSVAILANFSSNSGNQSEINSNITRNQTNQTHTNISINKAAANLWSWGKIPMGYGLNKNGTLIELGDQEWKPSI